MKKEEIPTREFPLFRLKRHSKTNQIFFKEIVPIPTDFQIKKVTLAT